MTTYFKKIVFGDNLLRFSQWVMFYTFLYPKKWALQSCICFIFISLLLQSYVMAEDNPENDFTHSADSHIRFMPYRGIKAASGKIEMVQAEAEYDYEFKVFGKLPVRFGVDTEYIGLDTATKVKLPSHLTGLSTDIETVFPFFSVAHAYQSLGVNPSFYSDNWNTGSSSFRIPLRYFIIYQTNKKLTLLGGLALYPHYENKVLPILGFIYKPNDKLAFTITPEKPNISYILNEKINVFVEGDINIEEFEVKGNDSRNAILRYSESHAGCGIGFKINKFILSTLSVGNIVNRSLRYRDGQGKISVKNGVYTALSIEIHL